MGKAFDITLVGEFLPQLVQYLGVTLQILAVSTVFGIVIGIAAAIPRLFRIPILSQLVIVYVSFIRGTPILIQLFLIFYGVPALFLLFDIDLTRMDPLYFVMITYSLSNGAVFSEIFRGAIQAIDYGQTEAAYSVGMSDSQTFFRIIIPQAIGIAFPNMANCIISSLKDTSLAFTIGVMDMVGRGETLIASTAHALEVYISLSIIYYIVVLVLEKLFRLFEKRVNRYKPDVVSSA
ncbi:amino acid ABC transporter permease [Parageobacillus thermoglucosidasius]|uniref:Amino acid ABC transporter permease n=1 Tax=Parageobacillus thermoglucosidasius TaxID=1426 RepID=A0AB38R1S1_PARTM|nr:amino acid ABC transporter permease [Parageobacillus thermoglucosidasius]MBY6270216.1 cysteine ABC transporter permease [Parageobacillus thermoglucosidasius]OUM89143.1 MAG: cysteine ABC transporter permease [Parageobacillus thermoglucosidasius]UOE76667.1 amino acid ABC transporter permease [Parageobacillus thermoglucosidasius]GMO01457.1 sulfur-containing amino acid ABC transporter permease TcyL [Parageobacillus thermoglucosidasius]